MKSLLICALLLFLGCYNATKAECTVDTDCVTGYICLEGACIPYIYDGGTADGEVPDTGEAEPGEDVEPDGQPDAEPDTEPDAGCPTQLCLDEQGSYAIGTKKCVDASNLKECVPDAVTNCPAWQTQSCDNCHGDGLCCTSDCTTEGQKRCETGPEECQEVTTNCLKWQTANPCASLSDDFSAYCLEGQVKCKTGNIQINQNTAQYQFHPYAMKLDNGGFAVAWSSGSQKFRAGNSSSWDNYFNRYYVNTIAAAAFNSLGEVINTEVSIGDTVNLNHSTPMIKRLNDNRFLLYWNSYKLYDNQYFIYGQLLNSSGGLDGISWQVNTYFSNKQYNPNVAELNNGNLVFVWQSYNGTWDIYRRSFNSNGELIQAGDERINLYMANTQKNPAIAELTAGGIVVVWESAVTNQGINIRGRLFDSAGGLFPNEILINTYTTGDQSGPYVKGLAHGGFIVVWQSDAQDEEGSKGIYGRIFDSEGIALSSEFRISGFRWNQFTVSDQFIYRRQNDNNIKNYRSIYDIADVQNNNYLISWASIFQDGESDGVFGVFLDSNISTVPIGINGSEFKINSTTDFVSFWPIVLPLTNHQFVIIWRKGTNNTDYDGSKGIFGQAFSSSGDKIESEFQVNNDTYSTHEFVHGVPLNNGSYFVVWQSLNSGSYSIWGRLFNVDPLP